MCLQQAVLLTWARTQGGVALSSMESEYRGLAVGAQESLLAKHLLGELGYEVGVTIRCDSTSAAAAAQRRGVLHVKHMALRLLFIKELVERGLISLERVSSEANTADWLTKPLGQKSFERCLELLPGLVRGLVPQPPQTAHVQTLTAEWMALRSLRKDQLQEELMQVDADICSLDRELRVLRKRCGRERRASRRMFNQSVLERLRRQRDEVLDQRSVLRMRLHRLISEREYLKRPLWSDIEVEQ